MYGMSCVRRFTCKFGEIFFLFLARWIWHSLTIGVHEGVGVDILWTCNNLYF